MHLYFLKNYSNPLLRTLILYIHCYGPGIFVFKCVHDVFPTKGTVFI